MLHLDDVHRDLMVDRYKTEINVEYVCVREGEKFCDRVHVCCMCSEANWSRVSRMPTRLMASWYKTFSVCVCLRTQWQLLHCVHVWK